MVTKSRSFGTACGAAVLVLLVCSFLPMWRVWDVDVFSDHWSFGTLWQAARHFPANYRDADSTFELLSLHWWNGLMIFLVLGASTLIGIQVFRTSRQRSDEPDRLGWGLGRLTALKRQGTLLARGRLRPHPRRAIITAPDSATTVAERALSDAERRLIHWLLEHGSPDAANYLAQLDRTRVAAQCPCGCPTVDLAVAEVRPAGGDKVILSDYQWQGPGGEQFGVFVFARAGFLAGLEVWSIDGLDTPSRLPDTTELRPLH